MIRIACIGSRKIPLAMAKFMEELGEFIVKQGWYIASGNAIGSDAAYARGGNRVDPTHVILYLTGPNHNKKFFVDGNKKTWTIKPEWKEVARAHHPIYDKLDPYIQGLMDRNAGILSKADKCLAFLNHKKQGGGGTGHGWRIAGAMGIPRLDLAKVNLKDPAKVQKVFEFLEKPLDLPPKMP